MVTIIIIIIITVTNNIITTIIINITLNITTLLSLSPLNFHYHRYHNYSHYCYNHLSNSLLICRVTCNDVYRTSFQAILACVQDKAIISWSESKFVASVVAYRSARLSSFITSSEFLFRME